MRAINFVGGVLGEVSIAHHSELLACMVVVQCDYQRVIVVHRLASLVGGQVVHVEGDWAQWDGLLEAGIQAKLEPVVSFVRREKPNLIKSELVWTYIVGQLFWSFFSVTHVFTLRKAGTTVSTTKLS